MCYEHRRIADFKFFTSSTMLYKPDKTIEKGSGERKEMGVPETETKRETRQRVGQ